MDNGTTSGNKGTYISFWADDAEMEVIQRILDALPPGPVVIIGSDVPGIRPHHIATAFRALGGSDAVLGPAIDGGYWLIGLKRRVEQRAAVQV